jgi:hypothetical protein
MRPSPFPHKQYLRFVHNRAGTSGSLRPYHRHFEAWRKLEKTNLDSASASSRLYVALLSGDDVV